MKCRYHPDKNADKQCNNCKEPLCGQCAILKDNYFFCSRCIVVEAARDAADSIDQRLEKKQRKAEMIEDRKSFKKTLRSALQWGIVVIGLGVIAYQVPVFVRASKNDNKPLRNGTFETNAVTDECIRSLWKVARVLQEEKLPGPELICPASKKPFIITHEDGDVVARSPNPGLYGFREIRVSKLRPVPEVIK
jgi:hypothetical protein